MRVSQSSSSPSWLWLVVALLALGGCSTVRPEDKEYLAEPAMAHTSGGMAEAHEEHMLSNREGSMRGSRARGGGCGCN